MACAMPCSSELTQFLVAGLTEAELQTLAFDQGLAATHARAVEKSAHRRLGRPQRHLPGQGLERGAALPHRAGTARSTSAPGGSPSMAPAARRWPSPTASTRPSIPSWARNSRGGNRERSLIQKVFSRFMEGQDPTEFSLTEKIAFLAQGITSGKIFELAKPMNASLWKQFAGAFSHSDFKESLARETAGIAEPERRAFIIANLLANQVAYRIFTKFVKELSSGKLMESIQDISTLAPIALALAPYFYAFRSQTPDRRWLFNTVEPIRGRVPAAAAKPQAGLVHRYAGGCERRRQYHPPHDRRGHRGGQGHHRRHLAHRDQAGGANPHQELPAHRRIRDARVRAAEALLPARAPDAGLHPAREIHRAHHFHARPRGPHRAHRRQDPRPPHQRHLSHRFPAVRRHPDR